LVEVQDDELNHGAGHSGRIYPDEEAHQEDKMKRMPILVGARFMPM
jgi:hypothetical protein